MTFRAFIKKIAKFHLLHVIVAVAAIAFSSWLMFHTFSYNPQKHAIRISYRLWSDFGAHIPMIRSFSMGDNIDRFLKGQTQYPIFPGEPIRYHFLFFLLVGILEKSGVRIDWALNIPSIIGFAALVYFIFYLAKKLTGSTAASLLACIFFLFNGSLGFMQFFDKYPISSSSLTDIIGAKDFPAFAPWGKGLVTAFWNLNIYTNQRHLALAFAIGLGFIITCIRLLDTPLKRHAVWIVPWSIMLGLLPYFHQPMLLIIAIVMAVYFIVFPKLRPFLLFTGMISAVLIIPQLLSVRGNGNSITWYPGYIFHNEYQKLPLIERFIQLAVFWIHNIGIHSLFIPAGYMLLSKRSRRIILPMIPLFIIPNMFKFTVEASANHKFFNFVMIFGGIISANAFVSTSSYLWNHTKHILIRGVVLYALAVTLLLFTLSGIIDFFVINNDIVGSLSDIGSNKAAAWIAEQTPNNAIFFNSQYLYHPASLAGRAIFLGWPYFAWSAGYKENRMPIMDTFYESDDDAVRCSILKKYHISYVTAENISGDVNLPDISVPAFLKRYTPSYLAVDNSFAIFETKQFCKEK